MADLPGIASARTAEADGFQGEGKGSKVAPKGWSV
jgi:hypothetical protein